MNKIDWIPLKCICGRAGNYLPTVSGKTPCDNTKCHNLLDVPLLNKNTGTGITQADIDEILGGNY